jgi:mannose/cellobiose epimerase-like protein (N-acyl-D-glucosamine 2-epimerase family)
LSDSGERVPERGVLTWLTGRTVHVYALGHLLGVPGSRGIAQAALDGLIGPEAPLRDPVHGGWYGTVLPDGSHSEGKEAYQHAFVLLAASSGVVAGLDGADRLLDEGCRVYLDRFWDDDAGMSVDTWDTAFEHLDPYRGINANMHSLEAMLAVADVTRDPGWLDRATRIATFVVTQAAEHGWRIPEHYSSDWAPRLDLNRDKPDDAFKPFGATVGHGLEWSRLLLHLEASLRAAGRPAADGPTGTTWAEAAASLFDRAVEDGWAADGAPGFVYTTDWSGVPVVRQRMHWVVAEGINAAAALHARTGDPGYATFYETWWDYVDRFVLDHEHGSWHHELDASNRPASTVWPGKADLYHAFQTTLVPRLPLAPTMAAAVAGGWLADT